MVAQANNGNPIECPNKLKENSFDDNATESTKSSTLTDEQIQTKLDEKFAQVDSMIQANIQQALTSVEHKLNTKIDMSHKSMNTKLKELEEKHTSTYGSLNQSMSIMSSKFDKLLNKLFPDDEEESTASPMDTGDGGKVQ